VPDHGAVVDDHYRTRAALAEADAEFGLLASERLLAGRAADAVPEPADLVPNLAAERCVPAVQVAHRHAGRRHAQVCAAHYPGELVREPGRLTCLPPGQSQAAHASHGWVGIGVGEELKPSGVGDGVVVEERHNLAAGQCDPRVPGTREPLLLAVLGHRHVRQRGGQPHLESRVVIDDEDRLECRQTLVPHRRHRLERGVPPVLPVSTNDHRDAGHGMPQAFFRILMPRIPPGSLSSGSRPSPGWVNSCSGTLPPAALLRRQR
jgi:hypothetical protein